MEAGILHEPTILSRHDDCVQYDECLLGKNALSRIESGYISVFIIPSTWSFYLTSVLIGMGAAYKDRRTLFIALLVTSGLGTLSFLLLRKSSHEEDDDVLAEEESQPLLSFRPTFKQRASSALKEATTDFKTMLHLLGTKPILLLSFSMAYSGLELSFYSGVYGTCIGATTYFGESSKALIGISGIAVGIGEIIGGGLFGLVLKNNHFRRTSVVFLGMVVHFVSFYLIYLNIPNDAPVVFNTSSQLNPYLSPSVSIAVLCSFLLGLGDSCFNTQLYSILGCVYTEQSSSAFAIFKFIQSVFAAVAFFYSGYLLLSWQLIIMVIMGFMGTLCFCVVDRTLSVSADLPE
ncbi:UNC93-like protein MFSD11 [Bagarius yarrelli]|uniref:UNC93-like protein MFSD11 n=1 Tax=Bagarius yarrelli TaxID=175774 RepID=A0A556V2K7_BAGYA|nr:UNC93-like protein MFSD11 [Bagarius yarrelli]